MKHERNLKVSRTESIWLRFQSLEPQPPKTICKSMIGKSIKGLPEVHKTSEDWGLSEFGLHYDRSETEYMTHGAMIPSDACLSCSKPSGIYHLRYIVY